MVFLLMTLVFSSSACQEEQSLAEQFEMIEASEQVEGVDLGKFDQAEAITQWLLKEQDQFSMLEGRNQKGQVTFAAIIENSPSSEQTKISLLGEQQFEFTVDLISMNMVEDGAMSSSPTQSEE